jgi:hypothetical protein
MTIPSGDRADERGRPASGARALWTNTPGSAGHSDVSRQLDTGGAGHSASTWLTGLSRLNPLGARFRKPAVAGIFGIGISKTLDDLGS